MRISCRKIQHPYSISELADVREVSCLAPGAYRTRHYYEILALILVFWWLLLAGCSGVYDPCAGADEGQDCFEGSDCGQGYGCWCGFCIPEQCTGEIWFCYALESAVRRKIDKSKGSIRYEDVRDINSLSAGGETDNPIGVFSLKGIQCLTGLRELTLHSSDGLSDLGPLSGLSTLRKLSIVWCAITDLSPLSSLTGLVELDLSENYYITDISALSDLTALTRLILNDALDDDINIIHDLSPLSDMVAMESLDISWNRINDIGPLSNMTGLVELNATGPMISDISPLAGMTRLTDLIIDANDIVDISPLSVLTSLERLDLSWNNIREIHPLVENAGIGEGDAVYLGSNPIDCTEQSPNIQELRSRGVKLSVGCP